MLKLATFCQENTMSIKKQEIVVFLLKLAKLWITLVAEVSKHWIILVAEVSNYFRFSENGSLYSISGITLYRINFSSLVYILYRFWLLRWRQAAGPLPTSLQSGNLCSILPLLTLQPSQAKPRTFPWPLSSLYLSMRTLIALTLSM